MLFAALLSVVTSCAQVLEELYSKPVLFERSGGSIPATGYFKDILGAPTTCAWLLSAQGPA